MNKKLRLICFFFFIVMLAGSRGGLDTGRALRAGCP